MSEFIEGSKHKEFTAAVEKHFAGGNVGQRPGQDPLTKATFKTTSPGALPAAPVDMFEVIDSGSGVGYTGDNTGHGPGDVEKYRK